MTTKVHVLTEAKILEACDSDHPAKIKELEIIFTPTNILGGFEKCVQLHTLRIMNTNLKRISHLEPLGRSLQSLTLCDQNITKIENLECLPNLRELYVHRNCIRRIEGLDHLRKLERLWLCSNRIETIEGLDNLGRLAELWLQNNQISSVGDGLGRLASLECLALGGNRSLKNLRETVRGVNTLPLLSDLSFVDPTFGECPRLVREDGYRNYVVAHLKTITSLDGVAIDDTERAKVDRSFMRRARSFKKKLDAIRRESEREMNAIEAEREERRQSCERLKCELAAEFRRLDRVVADGEKRIEETLARQNSILTGNRKALEKALHDLREKFEVGTNRLIAKEREAAKREEATARRVQRRAREEIADTEMLAEITRKGPLFANLLDSGSAEFACLGRRLCGGGLGGTLAADGSGREREAKAEDREVDTRTLNRKTSDRLSAYPLHAFEIHSRLPPPSSALLSRHPKRNDESHAYLFYVCASAEQLRDILERGFESVGGPVLFFSSADRAIERFDDAAKKRGVDVSSSSSSLFYRILECRVALRGSTHTHFGSTLCGSSVEALLRELPASGTSGQARFDVVGRRDSVYFFKTCDKGVVVPEYYVLCADRNAGAIPTLETALVGALSTSLKGRTTPLEMSARLEAFERKVRKVCAEYERRTWSMLSPVTAEELASADAEEEYLKDDIQQMQLLNGGDDGGDDDDGSDYAS